MSSMFMFYVFTVLKELITATFQLLIDLIPVSYTHLDVYKRQVLNQLQLIALHLKFINNFFLRLIKLGIAIRISCQIFDLWDVYKRQL